MPWCLRESSCYNLYKPSECPNYNSMLHLHLLLANRFLGLHVLVLFFGSVLFIWSCVALIKVFISWCSFDFTNAVDLFTIKLRHGGGLLQEGGAYVGGTYRYVDSVDIDEISMFELGSMLEEGFGHLGYCDFYYKMPNIDGLCSITKNADLVNMCTKIDSSRMVYMYVVTVSVGEIQ